MMDNKIFLKSGLEKINIQATDLQLELMLKFMKLVLEENKKFNLTAIKDEKEFIEKHLIDSATIIPLLNETKFQSLLDIGSGAGFPGIIIAIFFPERFITLIDSTNKKTIFMTKAATMLELTNVLALPVRAEELKRNEHYSREYDVITARAVASLNILSELALPLNKIGGSFVAMKAASAKDELNESKNAIKTLGGKYIETKKINLPYSNAERNLIIIKKIKEIPSTFPRKYSTIKKQPL